jgi:hypothetical protein
LYVSACQYSPSPPAPEPGEDHWTLAQLKERGLPLELIEHLRKAPVQLDDDEDDDPYGLRK